MKSVRFRLAAVVVGCLAAVAAAGVADGVESSPSAAAGVADAVVSTPSPESIFPGCAWGAAWGEVVNTDTELAHPALNAVEPDNSASYWILTYTYEPGETITLNGTYPDSRFWSFQVGTQVLTDYQIAPDPGSVNPFQPASGPRQGGHPSEQYTVTLSSDAQPGETNTLPLAPSGDQPGATVSMTMRDYLQNGGVWAVPAPSVTFSYEGVSQLIPACSREQMAYPGSTTPDASTQSAASVTNDAPSPTGSSSAVTSQIAPRSVAAESAADDSTSTVSSTETSSGSPGEINVPFYATAPSGPAGNQDTQYLAANVTPPTNGDVLVVKGKVPTTTYGDTAQPWPSPGVDLRYWSLCDYTTAGALVVNDLSPNYLWGGQVDWGCRNNDQIRVSSEGHYTIVIGTEAQRAAIENIPGVTFLPFSEAFPAEATSLLIRNQQPSPSFAQVIATWPTAATQTPAQAAAADEQAMGAYYPTLSFSTISALEQSAVQGH
jgi:hypothetical protein